MPDTGPSFDDKKTPYNYLVVIDAGSSGSRVHIYTYPSKQEKGRFPTVSKLGNKWAKKITPGISTFAENSKKVGKKHIKKLLEYAKEVIPDEQQPRTPIFLHATAGMRLLEQDQIDGIMKHTCKYLKKKSRFMVSDCDKQLGVIDGETEGLFGWLGLNYLIGGIEEPDKHNHGKDHTTYGFMDMGGASSQITFVPNTTEIDEHKDLLYKMHLKSLNGKQDAVYNAYSQTFLGMGVNEARRRYLEGLKLEDGVYKDPCMPKNYKGVFEKRDGGDDDDDSDDDDDDEKEKQKEENLVGTGDYKQCAEKLKPLLSGIKQQEKPDFDFEVNHFVGVSEYWDSTKAYQLGGNLEYSQLVDKVDGFCKSDWNNLTQSSEFADLSPDRLTSLCFKSSWLLGVIDEGLQFPKQHKNEVSSKDQSLGEYLQPLQAAEKINNVEFSWTLGRALLYATGEMGKNDGDSGIMGPKGDSEWEFGQPLKVRPNLGDDLRGDHDDDDDWDLDDLIDKHSHRLIGSLLFLGILLVVVWLLLGKSRRGQIWASIKGRISRTTNSRQYRPVDTTTNTTNASSQSLTAEEAEEFELNEVDDQEFRVSSDEEGGDSGAKDASDRV